MIQHIKKGDVVRVGATTDPKSRIGSYKSQGYIGTVAVAKTTNMKAAENRLLEACGSSKKSGKLNVQKTSNVPAEKGSVYVIEGKKK